MFKVNNENDELVQSNPTLDGIVTGEPYFPMRFCLND